MQLSINWLRDYLQKQDTKIDPKDLAERLTMRGIPVNSVHAGGGALDKVVVGRILTIEKHPSADRLQVTRVIISDATDAERLQIVCGAKNIEEGDLVPVALVGAELPGDIKIKRSKIRSVESTGMLCSGKELGVSDESDGILQLPKHAKLGDPVSTLLGANTDTVLEIELTANRPDCLSIIGLAREAAPILRTKLREPKPPRFRISAHRTSSVVNVEVQDTNLCPRYVARVLDSLKVAPSPDWIQQRLSTLGIRPINNIVDVTNFVMMEYGQPLHAFDLRRIESGTITIGPCKSEMDFKVLSGETVRLIPGDILILDGEKPIALAGIIGGENSQVSEDTTSIVLESAAFNPIQIRKTAKRLGLSTESSKRFEKHSDLAAVATASDRAASLLRDTFSANVYHPAIDTDEFGVKEEVISVDLRDVRKLSGLHNLTSDTAADCLESIGISCHKKSMNVLSVRLPTFRADLNTGVDFVEEVARLVGYDVIPNRMPLSLAAYNRLDEGQFNFEMKTRDVLEQLGLRETISYSFVSEELLDRYDFPKEGRVSLENPISEDMKTLRVSLLPSLLETYARNRNRRISDLRIFEVANVYRQSEKSETGVKETPHVAGLISGHVNVPSWASKSDTVNYYHGKGIVESLNKQLTTVLLGYEKAPATKILHPLKSAVLKLGLKDVGYVGEIHPWVRDTILKTSEPVVLFELNLRALRKYERGTVRFKTPSRFPEMELDLSFVVDKALTGQALLETISHTGGNLLAGTELFDVYEGDNLPSGKKSLAFRLAFQSQDHTLKDTEVHSLRDKIIDAVKQKHAAEIRA